MNIKAILPKVFRMNLEDIVKLILFLLHKSKLFRPKLHSIHEGTYVLWCKKKTF